LVKIETILKTGDFNMSNFELKKMKLNRIEANQFVESVVDSAIVLTEEDGEVSIDYDPLAQLTAIKLNICVFYGKVDLENLDEDDLYDMCSDINIEDLKAIRGFNYIQLQDLIKASEMKIEYIKSQMIEKSVDKRSSLDRLIDEIGEIIIPFLEKLANIEEIDSGIINQFAKRFANEEFDITPENLVAAVLNSDKYTGNTSEDNESPTTIQNEEDVIINMEDALKSRG
jgi:hypothetical protein